MNVVLGIVKVPQLFVLVLDSMIIMWLILNVNPALFIDHILIDGIQDLHCLLIVLIILLLQLDELLIDVNIRNG